MNPIEQTSTTVWTILLLIRLCVGWCYSYLPGSKHSQLGTSLASFDHEALRTSNYRSGQVHHGHQMRRRIHSCTRKGILVPFRSRSALQPLFWIACGPPTSTRHIASARYSKIRGMPTLCLAMKLHVVLTRYPVAFQHCHRHLGGTCPK